MYLGKRNLNKIHKEMVAPEIEDGPRVLGLGLGLFLLILLWSFTLAIILICTRLSSAMGLLLTSTSALITGILLAIPRNPPVFKRAADDVNEAAYELEEEFRLYDNLMIWKVLLMVIMGVFVIVGLVAFFCMHCMDTVYAKPIKRIKL